MRVAVLVAVAGCGRLGFAGAGDGANADAATDGAVDAATACGFAPTAADPLLVSGPIYRYTSFANDHAAVTSSETAAAAAIDATTATVIDAQLADDLGRYTLTIPTGGVPRALVLLYTAAGYEETRVHLDEPFAASLVGMNQNLWTAGDGPLWSSSAMSAVYSGVGVPYDDTKTSINIAVRTCDGAAIPDVVVRVDPAPEALAHLTSSGATTTATQLPYSHALAYNAALGPTRITATAPGLVFPEVTIDAQGAGGTNVVLLRPYE